MQLYGHWAGWLGWVELVKGMIEAEYSAKMPADCNCTLFNYSYEYNTSNRRRSDSISIFWGMSSLSHEKRLTRYGYVDLISLYTLNSSTKYTNLIERIMADGAIKCGIRSIRFRTHCTYGLYRLCHLFFQTAHFLHWSLCCFCWDHVYYFIIVYVHTDRHSNQIINFSSGSRPTPKDFLRHVSGRCDSICGVR